MNLQVMYVVMEIGLVAFLLVSVALLLFAAVMRRDFDMIAKRPFAFVVELLVVSIVPAIPILLFAATRGMEWDMALAWFYGLAIKFGVFHVLLQISGFYTYWLQV